mmetsp:Transcript_13211/g.55346  ORF Transcript_13211/g.55346 Transcript_13211/m.55346 type:complete len:244 (-) Transcript_13211:6585-7316(-)
MAASANARSVATRLAPPPVSRSAAASAVAGPLAAAPSAAQPSAISLQMGPSVPTCARASSAPAVAAAASHTSSLSLASGPWSAGHTPAIAPSVSLGPAKRSAPESALSVAASTPPSALATPLARSVTSASTRGESSASRPSASAARMRTLLEPSLRHLTKVVCSCGTNGLRPTPPRCTRTPSARRMAALTFELNLSPTTRIRGPVMPTTLGRSALALARHTRSWIPSAALSRPSGEPSSNACR